MSQSRSSRREFLFRSAIVSGAVAFSTVPERAWAWNVLVLNGADGKVVVDTFVQPAWSNLKTALDKIGTQKIATVIDTHWHFDHADNNAALRKEVAQVVAHENTKQRMSQSHDLLGAKSPPRPPTRCQRRRFPSRAGLAPTAKR